MHDLTCRAISYHPAVCPSVSQVDESKTVELRIMKFRLHHTVAICTPTYPAKTRGFCGVSFNQKF